MGYSPWGGKESDTAERLHFLSFFEKQRSWPAMLRAMVLWVELQRPLCGWRVEPEQTSDSSTLRLLTTRL